LQQYVFLSGEAYKLSLLFVFIRPKAKISPFTLPAKAKKAKTLSKKQLKAGQPGSGLLAHYRPAEALATHRR